MRVTRVAHVSINVEGGLDATREFYRDVFGLADEPRPDIPGIRGHWHRLGANGDVELHLVDAVPIGSDIDPVGPHFCVYVDDLDAAISELDVRGIAYLRGAQAGTIQIWINDPAGNTIELQQDREAQ